MPMNTLMLAATTLQLGGDGFINQLVTFLVIGLCVGLLYAAAHYFAARPKAPAVALTVVNGLFIIVGVLVVINFLLGLTGKKMFEW